MTQNNSNPGPFDNPQNRVVSWSNKTTGQYNQKVVEGPDTGTHRFYNPQDGRAGEAGIERPHQQSDS